LYRAKNDIERNEVLSDLEINLQKINEHGKRADSIVKNMLEHSRTGKGSKIQTDINKLADEYFSLSFHGMAGNNPDFSCTLKKELASNLPQINAIQQDFSRVFVNLFNNAFYSVHQKKLSGNYADYVPVVSLKTILQDNSVIIKIADNGTGMPESVKDKIFQPFFTTKPTGQGTGLGLSLTHDIVKAHGGEIVVSGNEGEGAEFTITIPL
jgi:signal transduction histidine kinase